MTDYDIGKAPTLRPVPEPPPLRSGVVVDTPAALMFFERYSGSRWRLYNSNVEVDGLNTLSGRYIIEG